MKNKTIIFVLASLFFFSFATSSHAITITGSETVTTNSSVSYSATGCDGTVTWSVTGTGASISSNGVLTTGPVSCGGITVTARCSDGSIATKTARVTNAGQWVQTSICGYPGNGTTKTLITGKNRYTSSWCSICDSSICTGSICDPSPNCSGGWPNTCCGYPKLGCGNPGTATPAIGEVGGMGGCCNFSALITHVCHIIGNKVDEWQCPSCTNGQTISCYTGASETKGVGECKAGTQTCTNGQWGACVGEVLPSPEICGNDKDENCDGNVDEGCAVCEVSVKVSPSEVWPQKTGSSTTTATVIVSTTKPVPPDGCTINLKVEPVENSGGHNHNGNRPKGTLDHDTIIIPGSTSIVESVKYTSSEVAGEEKVIAEVNVKKVGEAIIYVKVTDLYSMPGGNYRFTGQRTAHPDNHYGRYYTVVNTRLLSEKFYKWFIAMLGINDMSLKWGGLFDIGPPDGSFWSPPHSSHRKGTSVDIDRQALGSNGWVRVDRVRIERLCREYSGRLVPEATIHCEFPDIR